MQRVSGRGRWMGNMVIYVCGVLLLGSAAAKLAHVPAVVTALAANGFEGGKLTIVGVLEILSAALLLVPVLRSVGLVFVSAFLGGAIATHLQHGQSIVPPSLILALIWLGAWLRYGAAVLWSFRRRDTAGEKGEAPNLETGKSLA